MAAIFLSHGGPGSILSGQDKTTCQYWKSLGDRIRKSCNGLVVFSAHWYEYNTKNTVLLNTGKDSLRDFGEFYRGIYEESYELYKGPTLQLLETVQSALQQCDTKLSIQQEDRGLDHGAWIPLRYMFPKGDFPVIQVQMPIYSNTGNPAALYEDLGKALAKSAPTLCVMASGGIVHNLADAFSHMNGRNEFTGPEDWALDFMSGFVDLLSAGYNDNEKDNQGSFFNDKVRSISSYSKAHPTPDHFLPFLVVHGWMTQMKNLTFKLENADQWSYGSLTLASLVSSNLIEMK